jgi:hypothetical protein
LFCCNAQQTVFNFLVFLKGFLLSSASNPLLISHKSQFHYLVDPVCSLSMMPSCGGIVEVSFEAAEVIVDEQDSIKTEPW